MIYIPWPGARAGLPVLAQRFLALVVSRRRAAQRARQGDYVEPGFRSRHSLPMSGSRVAYDARRVFKSF